MNHRKGGKLQTLIITQPIVTSGAVANPNSSAPSIAAIATSPQDPYRIGYQTILAAVQLTVPKEEISGVERTVLYDPAWIDSSSLDDPEYSNYLYGK